MHRIESNNTDINDPKECTFNKKKSEKLKSQIKSNSNLKKLIDKKNYWKAQQCQTNE